MHCFWENSSNAHILYDQRAKWEKPRIVRHRHSGSAQNTKHNSCWLNTRHTHTQLTSFAFIDFNWLWQNTTWLERNKFSLKYRATRPSPCSPHSNCIYSRRCGRYLHSTPLMVAPIWLTYICVYIYVGSTKGWVVSDAWCSISIYTGSAQCVCF